MVAIGGALQPDPMLWAAWTPFGWTLEEDVDLLLGTEAQVRFLSRPVPQDLPVEQFASGFLATRTDNFQVAPGNVFGDRAGLIVRSAAQAGAEPRWASDVLVADGRGFLALGKWNPAVPELEAEVREVMASVRAVSASRSWSAERTVEYQIRPDWSATQSLAIARLDRLANVLTLSGPIPEKDVELVDLSRRAARRQFRRFRALERGVGTIVGGHEVRFVRFESLSQHSSRGGPKQWIIQLQFFFDHSDRRLRVTSTRYRSFDWLSQEEELWELIAGLRVVPARREPPSGTSDAGQPAPPPRESQ